MDDISGIKLRTDCLTLTSALKPFQTMNIIALVSYMKSLGNGQVSSDERLLLPQWPFRKLSHRRLMGRTLSNLLCMVPPSFYGARWETMHLILLKADYNRREKSQYYLQQDILLLLLVYTAGMAPLLFSVLMNLKANPRRGTGHGESSCGIVLPGYDGFIWIRISIETHGIYAHQHCPCFCRVVSTCVPEFPSYRPKT